MSGSTNTHARKAPSDSKRWMNCTAALKAEEDHTEAIFRAEYADFCVLHQYLKTLPPEELSEDEVGAIEILKAPIAIADLDEDQRATISAATGNEYTREGTRAHDFGEAVLVGRKAIEDLPEEFREPVGVYVDECRRLVEEHPEGETFIEEKVSLFYEPDSTGTVDFAIVADGFVAVRDLKYGQGVLVSAFENPQLAIYALSLIEEIDDLYGFGPETELSIGIVQPRHREAEGVPAWEITLADLRAFCKPIREAARRIDEGRDLVFSPGEDTCRWCPKPLKARCAARLEAEKEGLPDGGLPLVIDELPDLSPYGAKAKWDRKPPEERVLSYELYGEPLDLDLLVKCYQHKAGLVRWLNDVEDYLTELALVGTPAEGTKLVLGLPGNREWTNEEEAETMLANQKLSKDERTVAKVISPTVAEKLLKEKLAKSTRLKNRFKALVSRSKPKKVLAPADDKREAIGADLDELPDVGMEDIP